MGFALGGSSEFMLYGLSFRVHNTLNQQSFLRWSFCDNSRRAYSLQGQGYLVSRRKKGCFCLYRNAIVRSPALFTQFSQIGIAVIGRDFMVVLSQRLRLFWEMVHGVMDCLTCVDTSLRIRWGWVWQASVWRGSVVASAFRVFVSCTGNKRPTSAFWFVSVHKRDKRGTM